MPEVRGYGAEHASNPHFTPGSWRNGGGPDAAGGGGNHVPNVMYSSAAPGSGKSSTATLQMPGEVPILRRLSDFGGSVDSMDTSEDASDRRGSATGSSVGKDGKERHGVGSRLSDLVEKGKGGKKPKRKKDKQGMMSDGQSSSSEVTTDNSCPSSNALRFRLAEDDPRPRGLFPNKNPSLSPNTGASKHDSAPVDGECAVEACPK